MKKYEMMIVVSGQLPEDLAQEMTGKAKKTIEEVGGLKVAEDFWGRRRLSYKIQGQDHGYYAVFNFSLEPNKLSELEAEIKMISEIIRFMVVSDDSKNVSEKSVKIVKEKIEKVEKESKEDVVEKVAEIKEEKDSAEKEKVKKEPKKEKIEKAEKIEKVEEESKEDVVEKVAEEKNDDDRLEELDKKIDEILND